MSDDYRKVANLLFELEDRESYLQTDLMIERSFRKVWGAVGVLLFLYGLMYGVYLSK